MNQQLQKHEIGRAIGRAKNAAALVVGEGSGIVILKRLEDALRDKDQIYATVAGIGLSNDIHGNLMSPDSEGQLRAMHAAYTQAGWSPKDVDLIECHGTGTPTGDRTEYNSMKELWGSDYPDSQRCVIGSVKSNVGHLLTAAGSAGLIKVLLAIKNQKLPPMANFEEPAEGIDLENGPFAVLNETTDWDIRHKDIPRRGAVSAFGFGGINAHVLLQAYRPNKTASVSASRGTQKSISQPSGEAIAIVGIDAHFGPWNSKEKFLARVK